MDSSHVFGGSMLLLFLLSVVCLVLLVFIYTTGGTCGAVTTFPSKSNKLTPVLRGVGVALQFYVLCLVDYC